VKEIRSGVITGLIWSDIELLSGYKRGDSYAFPEGKLMDWTISKPDGTEEGNFVGRFLDTYQTQDEPSSSEANNGSSTRELPLLPAPTGFVNDFANVLDAKTKEKLEQNLTDLKNQLGIEFAIATVKTTGDRSAFDYSLVVAREWGVGSKPDGAGGLLLVAVEDRKWRIQITRRLEKVLTNEEVKEIGDLMVPFFKEKKYGEGVTKCITKLIEVLKEKRSVQGFKWQPEPRSFPTIGSFVISNSQI